MLYLVVFYFLIFLVVYPYTIYPVFLLLFNSIRKKFIKRNNEVELNFTPKISFVLAVYNEENIIKKKIENFLSLNYPPNKVELIIGSDNSDDKTNKIINKYCTNNENITLIEYNQRMGKSGILNKICPKATGDILIFSDADTFMNEDSILNIIKNFQEENVGAVGGFVRTIKGSLSELSFHKKLEQIIKKLESDLFSTMGLVGGFYAIKKNLYPKIPDNIIIDDFFIPVKILEKGFKIKVCDNAIAHEKENEDIINEFDRRKRIGKGNYQLLNEFGFSLKNNFIMNYFYISHQVIKWLTPLFLLVIFVDNIILLGINRLYFIPFIGQIIIYLISFYEIITKNEIKSLNILRPIKFLKSFIIVNIAYFLGLVEYLKGIKTAAWDK